MKFIDLLSCCMISALLISVQSMAWSQSTPILGITMQDVLAHNDYQKSDPFHNAYSHRVSVMEADLYYDDGKVKVAHDQAELEDDLDLETMYLQPLRKKVRKYGSAYPDTSLSLALMLDIKNESDKVMAWILDLVDKYPDLFGTESKKYVIPLVISGQRPPQETWESLPAPVLIDGRLTDDIPVAIRPKIFMVSSSFSSVVPGTWSPHKLSETQKKAIKNIVDSVHLQNLKLRFWGVPDNSYFWQLQDELGIDIIGCDHLDELARHIE